MNFVSNENLQNYHNWIKSHIPSSGSSIPSYSFITNGVDFDNFETITDSDETVIGLKYILSTPDNVNKFKNFIKSIAKEEDKGGICIINANIVATVVPVVCSVVYSANWDGEYSYSIYGLNAFDNGTTATTITSTINLDDETIEISLLLGMILTVGEQDVIGRKKFTNAEIYEAPEKDTDIVNKGYVDEKSGGGGIPTFEMTRDEWNNKTIEGDNNTLLNELAKTNNSILFHINAPSTGLTKVDFYILGQTVNSNVFGVSLKMFALLPTGTLTETDNIPKIRLLTIAEQSSNFVDYGIVMEGITQTISSLKTFSTLPESSLLPTSDNQFVNKKYVDGKYDELKALIDELKGQ